MYTVSLSLITVPLTSKLLSITWSGILPMARSIPHISIGRAPINPLDPTDFETICGVFPGFSKVSSECPQNYQQISMVKVLLRHNYLPKWNNMKGHFKALKGCTHRGTEALRLYILMHRKGSSICGYTSLLR